MSDDDTVFTVKQGDTLPSLIEALYDDNGDLLDLDGATIELHLSDLHGNPVLISTDVVVVDDGTVRYDWSTGDTDTAGSYRREWQCTLASGEIVTVPNTTRGYLVRVTPQLA